MNDRDLIQFATEFREGILGGRPSAWTCAMVCWPLVPLLNMQGVKCEAVESDLSHLNHIWIRLADGRALDPTADQFNDLFPGYALPPVYLGEPLDIHADGLCAKYASPADQAPQVRSFPDILEKED